MSIIKTHDITLYGGTDTYKIVLKPLSDEHLPLLYKWNSDPEVVYWSDTGNAEVFSEDDIRGIYGSASENAFCFIAEVDGKIIGDFWLQKMNIPEISAKYPKLDVRRIEATIGEKTMWGKGIGTSILGMLVDFAFYCEHVDILYCFAADYNIRSQRTLLKQGFTLIDKEKSSEDSLRAREEYHYVLTQQEFIDRRRFKVPLEKAFVISLAALQPSQLYISEGKLQLLRGWFDPSDRSRLDPIPIKNLNGQVIMTDGHTRAVAAHLAGWDSLPVYWDADELDMQAYATDVKWCKEEGITDIKTLSKRIVPHKDYEYLWRKRCMEM